MERVSAFSGWATEWTNLRFDVVTFTASAVWFTDGFLISIAEQKVFPTHQLQAVVLKKGIAKRDVLHTALYPASSAYCIPDKKCALCGDYSP
jgi:hypothetical protein